MPAIAHSPTCTHLSSLWMSLNSELRSVVQTVCSRDRFLKKELCERRVRASEAAAPRGWGVRRGTLLLSTGGRVWGIFSILDLRWIRVQTECFLHSSPKAGLNAVLGIGKVKMPNSSNLYAHVKLREGSAFLTCKPGGRSPPVVRYRPPSPPAWPTQLVPQGRSITMHVEFEVQWITAVL